MILCHSPNGIRNAIRLYLKTFRMNASAAIYLTRLLNKTDHELKRYRIVRAYDGSENILRIHPIHPVNVALDDGEKVVSLYLGGLSETKLETLKEPTVDELLDALNEAMKENDENKKEMIFNKLKMILIEKIT